jgi:hypothetical protein
MSIGGSCAMFRRFPDISHSLDSTQELLRIDYCACAWVEEAAGWGGITQSIWMMSWLYAQ